METRVALIGVIFEDKEHAKRINGILHEFENYIVGRMGIPNIKSHIQVISLVVDAPEDMISSLSGKLGMIKGVSAKVIYHKENEKSGKNK